MRKISYNYCVEKLDYYAGLVDYKEFRTKKEAMAYIQKVTHGKHQYTPEDGDIEILSVERTVYSYSLEKSGASYSAHDPEYETPYYVD